jgi:hypothetical protein
MSIRMNADSWRIFGLQCPIILGLMVFSTVALAQEPNLCRRATKAIALPQTVTEDPAYRLLYSLRDHVIRMKPEDYLAIAIESEYAADAREAQWYAEGLEFEGTRSLTELTIWPRDGRIPPLLLRFVADLVERGLAGIVNAHGSVLTVVHVQTDDGGGCGRSRSFFEQTANGPVAILFVADRLD